MPEATLVLLLILLIFSKGVSSYYIVWLMPLIAIAFPGLRGFGACLGLLVIGNFELAAIRSKLLDMAQGNAEGSQMADTFYWAAIFLRHAAFVLLAALLALPRRPGKQG